MRKAKVVELPLQAGALSDDTDLAAKLHAIDMDKVRWRGGRWETIKGWSAFNASGVASGTARGGHTWATLDGLPVAAAASESAVYAWINGSRLTITPKFADVFLCDCAAVVADSPTVTIHWKVYTVSTAATAAASKHFLQAGDGVTISGCKELMGGLDLNGTWTVASVPTPTTFTFTHSSNANSSVAIDNENNTDELIITAAFRAGLATGTGDTATTRPRVYSMDNFGEDLVFCGSDGTPVFFWQPETSYSELITSGNFSASTGWTTGTGWAIGGGEAVKTAGTGSDLSQSVDGILEGGRTYEMSFTTSSYSAGTLDVYIDSIKIFPQISGAADDPTQTFTFRFVCPASPLLLKFTASSSCNVNLDNVSIKLHSIAMPINEAPQKNYALFVDGSRILNVLGSVEADGDFSPTLLRWCDQENFREWIPDTDNVAGEYPLGSGSYAVCGVVCGERNLILTNDGAFHAYFNGNGYSVIPLAKGCGAVGQLSVKAYGSKAFWPSLNGFWAYDGSQVLAIECPVKDRFIGKLRQYQENKTFAWINSEYGEVWFHYPHTSDGTEVSRYVSFNFIEKPNPWGFGTLNRTVFIRAGVFQNPIGIDSSGNIWSHETGTSFSGSGITLPFISTGYVTNADGDRWFGCRRYYADVENQTGNILFTVTGKRAAQGQNNTQVIGPLTLIPDQAKLDFLISSRQLKFKWASSTSTTGWRLGVVGLEMVTDRERR